MFITAELLIEYAIRIGTNDIMLNPEILEEIFYVDKLLNQGTDLTPPDSTVEIHEKLIMDEFQEKLKSVPRKQGETPFSDVFKNSMPDIETIKEYLKTASISIIHGFPRQPEDIPTISITLGSEDEEQYLGAKSEGTDITGKRIVFLGSDVSTQYHISVLTTNYDELVIWYHIIKYSLWRYRHAIEAYGLREQSFTWMDIEPSAEYLQAGLFIYQRTCILRGKKEEHLTVELKGYTGLVSNLDLVSEGEVIDSGDVPLI